MEKSFLKLIEDLRTADKKQKESISKDLSALLLDEKGRNLSGIMYSILKSVDIKNPSLNFKEILESDFITMRLREYVDERDSLVHLALGISFLQNFNSYREDYDSQVLDAILKEINFRGLEYFVNDITVNSTQWIH